MCFNGGLAERSRELVLPGRPRRVPALHGRGEVLRDGNGGESAGFTAIGAPADSIGDQHDGGDPLSAQRDGRGVGETGAMHHNLRVHSAQQKLILI